MKHCFAKRQTTLKSVLLIMLLMFTSLAVNAQSAESTGKYKPYVYISKTGYGITANGEPATYLQDMAFIEPSVLVYEGEDNKALISNRFYISYYLTSGSENGTKGTEVVEKGKTFSVDPVTGTRVNTRYGDVETGTSAGTVYIHVVATPTERYADQFTSSENCYRITLNKVKGNAPSIVYPKFVTDQTQAPVWTAVAGSTISLPNFHILYTTTDNHDKPMTLDVTRRFKISAKVEDEASKRLVEVQNDYKYISLQDGNTSITAPVINVKGTTGVAKIRFSFTPLYADAYDVIGDTVCDLNIVEGKITPKLVFANNDELAYTGMQNIPVQRPTVYDQYGNDITPCVSYKEYSKPLWIAWSAAPLADGKTMHTPNSWQSVTMQESGFQPLPDNQLRFHDGVCTTWAPDINAGDLVFQKGVRRNEFTECNQSDYDAAKLTSKIATTTCKIYCQVYPNVYNDAAKALYNASEDSYNFTVKPRPVKIELTPKPSSVNVTKGVEMDFENRFEVKGVHTCEIDNDTKFGRKKGETFTMYHNSDNQNFGCEYTVKFKTGEAEMINFPHEDKHITVDANGNKVDKATYTGDTWEVYWTVKGYGTDNAWKLRFLKEGNVKLTYSLYPYNIGYYEDGVGNTTAEEDFHVDEKVTPIVKVTPNPIVLYTTDKDLPTQPIITITDALGNDISSHYDLKFDEQALAKAGVKVNDNGDFVIVDNGPFKGDWSDLKVTAVPKANDPEKAIYNEGETTFRIIVKDLGDKVRFAWNVYNEDGASIGTGSGITDEADKKHGKLVFTSEGVVSGGYTIDAIPGLTVRLGNLAKQITSNANDDDPEAKAEETTAEDPWIVSSVDKKIMVYGAPVVEGNDGIPTNGTYYVLMPHTNGFLTVDGLFKANNTIVLIDEAKKEKQTIVPEKNVNGEMKFRYPLYANMRYYLYNAGDATTYEPLMVHGINFEPGFINQRNDAKPVENATAYANGFNGALPSLTDVKLAVDDHVKYGLTGNLATEGDDLSQYAEIDQMYGYVTTKDKGTAVKFSEGDKTISTSAGDKTLHLKKDHMKVYAVVKSAYANGGDHVVKVPAYNLYIGDIPTYIMEEGYTPNVLERNTTNNYSTNIHAYFGGWEHDTDKPYYKNNDFRNENLVMIVDSWKTSKMDSVGSNERVIDNFSFASFGTQNASSETVKTKFVYDKDNEDQTYKVPCRGTYIQFEPNESGTIAVYIVQNGMVAYDGDPDHASKSGNNKVKVNPVFIVDETGTPVELAKWNHSLEGNGTQAYTEAIIRCNYADMIRDCCKGDEANAIFEPNTKELLEKVGYIPSATDAEPTIKKGDLQKVYDVARELDPNAMPGSLGYSVITKAYTRYAFRVKAGKTYFLFMNGSKLGNDGYAFMPDQWTPARLQPEIAGTVTLDEKGPAAIDPTSKDEFLGKEETFDKYDKTVNVKLYHSFKANQWTALSLPISVNDTQIRKIFGDDAWVISLDQIADKDTLDNVVYYNVAKFLQHNYHWIVAGRPYFICPGKDFQPLVDEDGRQYVEIDSVTFEHGVYTNGIEGTGCVPARTLSQNNKVVFNFRAIYEPTTITTGDYFMGATPDGIAKLYRATRDTKLRGYRAFIDNQGKASDARIGAFGFGSYDDNGNSQTTGIEDVYEFYGNSVVHASTQQKGVYNVAGIKVADKADDLDKLPQGVYIVNGQVVVK